jgi:hypothetical protein
VNLIIASTGSYPRIGDSSELQSLCRTMAAIDRGERTFADLADAAKAKERVQQALTILPKERIWVDPDCELKTRTVEEAIAKLRACVEAAKAFRS